MKYLGLLMVLLLSACAPAVEAVSTTVTGAVTGETTVSYSTTAWDVVTELVDASSRLQPSAKHTYYSSSKVSDIGLVLSANPLKGGTGTNTSTAERISISISTEAHDGYVEVHFDPTPASSKVAREAAQSLIDWLDKAFIRYKG